MKYRTLWSNIFTVPINDRCYRLFTGCAQRINPSTHQQPVHYRCYVLLAASLFLAFLRPATAQSFYATPAPVHSQEVEFELANECYLYFTNPSGDTLRLKWRQLEMDMPAGWNIDLCDYGACYVGVPANGVMNAAYDTIQPYLKLLVQPGTTPGAAWCWFRVQDAADATNFADVYFSLFTPGTTGTTSISPVGAMRIFPNPARDFLVVENPTPQVVPARIVDLAGRIVWQADLAPNARTRVATGDWPAGLYFLQSATNAQRVSIEK